MTKCLHKDSMCLHNDTVWHLQWCCVSFPVTVYSPHNDVCYHINAVWPSMTLYTIKMIHVTSQWLYNPQSDLYVLIRSLCPLTKPQHNFPYYFVFLLSDSVCPNNDSVWPSWWLCMSSQWLCTFTVTMYDLHNDCMPCTMKASPHNDFAWPCNDLCAFMTTLCPQTMTLCAFLKESVCPSQWLLCATMTLSVPHSDSELLYCGFVQ